MNTTVSDMEIIKPPSKKPGAGPLPLDGYPSMREVTKPSKLVARFGSRSAGNIAQSGVSEKVHDKCGTSDCCQKCDTGKSKMKIKKILEKAKHKTKLKETMCNECGMYESKCKCIMKEEAEQVDEAKDYYVRHPETKKLIGFISQNKRGRWNAVVSHLGLDHSTSHPTSKEAAEGVLALHKKLKKEVELNEAGIEMGQDNDPKYSRESEVDRINYQFDNVFRNKFANPYLIVNAVTAILERFSINCPVMNPSGKSEVFVLHIHSKTGTNAFVYIAIERDGRGQYDAFVQMVDEAGLAALHGVVHAHESEAPTLPDYPTHWILQQRHTGNI